MRAGTVSGSVAYFGLPFPPTGLPHPDLIEEEHSLTTTCIPRLADIHGGLPVFEEKQ